MSGQELERPLKLGWLKKQRSIVKNWQHRYFVLKGQQLYYYKDEDDAKPQGCLSLQGSTIQEVPTNPEEGAKFIFEIIPGVPGEPPRAGQDPCVLMASSQGEMDEWVKSLRRALGSASGAVFGQRLADTVAYEQRFGQPQVPVLVQKCAQFILERGRSEEGIFRLPGQDTVVKQLRDAFDAGERPSFHRDTDVHTVASLLKLYLRELPEPVVPWAQYEDFLLCGQALDAEETKVGKDLSGKTSQVSKSHHPAAPPCSPLKLILKCHIHMVFEHSQEWRLHHCLEVVESLRDETTQGHEELLKQLSLLPRDNYNLLSYLCRFLHEIQLNSSVNKMSVDNLATVFGVNLIRPKIEDPATIMRGTPRVQKVMTVLIGEHRTLFPASEEVPLSPPVPPHAKPVPVPRSSVGWGAAEDPAQSRGPMRDDPNASGAPGAAASPGAPGEDTEPKETLGMWKAQPRKRTQTLPTRKSVLAEAAPAGKGSLEKRDVFARDFWKSGSRSALPDGHKRTLSHDLFKLLDLHRASSCDNAPPSPAESGDGSGSSPSSGISEQEFLPCPTPSPGPEPKGPASPATEVAKPEQESRELLPDVMLDLQKEMQAQKKDYEEQIQSLQKENYEVWAKVVRLNQELEREKKKSEELELKLVNVERLREDMERKNKMLEEQIKNLTKPTSKSGAKTK
ncbi:Rho GTPase activating protein 25 [Willisornis vidua]|uniref:Rho GTPase activating protein 25 n=1 Tax=Willisornis vidua TaxID=1566151 RepID=A0ABQ9DH36_9PASS|nr:Rho GTPase activating protein 25 [Willisornis vidua]